MTRKTMPRIRGVDFSHWQANVDFAKLANNDIRFAIFKAGEIPPKSSREFTDEKYGRNISESARHGIISGAYYYFHPSIGASRQARHFDTVMKAFGQPDLPPVIDVEDTDQMEPERVAAVLKAMVDALVGRGYRTPIIYSRWGFLVNQAGEPYWLKQHLLWLAQYGAQLTNKPADMRNVVMWQYTDCLRLPGVGVNLDGNYWLAPESELFSLAGWSPSGEPPAPPDPIEVEEPVDWAPQLPPDQEQEPEPEQTPQPLPPLPEPPAEIPPRDAPDALPQPLPEPQPPSAPPGRPSSTSAFWWVIDQLIKELVKAFNELFTK